MDFSYFDDQSEASFTTAMATPSKPQAQPLEHTWDAEETSRVMPDPLDDKENAVENTENTEYPIHPQYTENFHNLRALNSTTPPNALDDKDANYARQARASGCCYTDGEPSSSPKLHVDRTLSMDEHEHEESAAVNAEPLHGDRHSASGENTSSTAELVAQQPSPEPSDESWEINEDVNEAFTLEAQSEVEYCQDEPSSPVGIDVEENNNEASSPISVRKDPAETVADDDDEVVVFEEMIAVPTAVDSEVSKLNVGSTGEVMVELTEAKVGDNLNDNETSETFDLFAAFDASQVDLGTDKQSPVEEDADGAAALIPAGKEEAEVCAESTNSADIITEVIPAVQEEVEVRSQSADITDVSTETSELKEVDALRAETVNSTEHPVQPLLPSIAVKAERVPAQCEHTISSPSVPTPTSSTSSRQKNKKSSSKKTKKSTRKKRTSESTASNTSRKVGTMDFNPDFAATYKLEPTIPRGPKRQIERRPSQNIVVEKKPVEKDFAETYKLEATIPRGPELNAERRCTMAATRRAILGKSPPPPPEPKVAIDYAKAFKMEPTIPKSPQFSQKLSHAQQKTASVSDDNKNAIETPDLALTYKLEPTVPKDLPIHTHTRRPSKDISSSNNADADPEKEQVDYAKCYNGEPTKPDSPQLSFMVKKKSNMPKPASNTTASSDVSSSPSCAQFKARPLPSYIRRTSSGISPRRASRMNTVSPPAARTQFKARPLPSYIRRTASGISPRSAPMAAAPDTDKPKSPKFKARPMPNFDRIAIPPRVSPRRDAVHTGSASSVSSRPSNSNNSNPGGNAPYVPLSIALHEQSMAAWNTKIAAENRALEERRNFKARPLSVDMLEGACFVPVLGQFSPTRPVDVVTYSRDRAHERHLYDTRNAERVRELEKAQQMAEEARRLDEIAKTKERLDKNAFRARPVPQSLYRDPLAVPLSPHTPKNKIKRKKRPSTSSSVALGNEENHHDTDNTKEHAGEESPASTFSPGDMLANVRKALGKLSPV